MTQDIIGFDDGEDGDGDLLLATTDVGKAANVVGTQLGSLSYNPTFGVDLRLFLESELRFPNQSFSAYLVQRLCEHDVNVAQVIETVQTFTRKLAFKVGNTDASGGGAFL